MRIRKARIGSSSAEATPRAQIMEMDPRSPILARVRSNPFAFTAFASTEPYLKEYLSFPLEAALEDAGFEPPAQAPNSPRHRTVVAHKPAAR